MGDKLYPNCICCGSQPPIVVPKCCDGYSLPAEIDVTISAAQCSLLNGTYRMVGGSSISDAIGGTDCFSGSFGTDEQGGYYGYYDIPDIPCTSGASPLTKFGMALTCYDFVGNGTYRWTFWWWFCSNTTFARSGFQSNVDVNCANISDDTKTPFTINNGAQIDTTAGCTNCYFTIVPFSTYPLTVEDISLP